MRCMGGWVGWRAVVGRGAGAGSQPGRLGVQRQLSRATAAAGLCWLRPPRTLATRSNTPCTTHAPGGVDRGVGHVAHPQQPGLEVVLAALRAEQAGRHAGGQRAVHGVRRGSTAEGGASAGASQPSLPEPGTRPPAPLHPAHLQLEGLRVEPEGAPQDGDGHHPGGPRDARVALPSRRGECERWGWQGWMGRRARRQGSGLRVRGSLRFTKPSGAPKGRAARGRAPNPPRPRTVVSTSSSSTARSSSSAA